jgi:prolyl oligopeptidase
MPYPPAPRVDLVEVLHGVEVRDPFRPLEQADNPATIAWVEAENALTRRFLDGPDRDALVERLRALHRYPRASVPAVRGSRVFFTENDGTRNQAVLYVAEAGTSLGEAGNRGLAAVRDKRLLLDPNALDASGTTAVTAFEPDANGARVVYALSRGGSDVQELIVRDVASNTDLLDRISWVKFASVAWAGDGFFYTRFPEPATVAPEHAQYFCQVWYHRLGDLQAADRLVFNRPDAPDVVFEIDMTSDGRHLVITSRRGASDNAEVHVLPVAMPIPSADFNRTDIREIVSGFASGWHFIDGADGRLYLLTDAGAPLGRIVRVDLDKLTGAAPDLHVIVAESDDKIAEAAIAGGQLLVSSLHHASSRLHRFDLDGSGVREIALPEIGTIAGIGGRWHDARCYVTFTSFTTPPQILACDVDAAAVSSIDRTELPIDPSAYVTEQVWYPSKDGTQVSMFLVSRRDHDRGSVGPVLLSGYGGFNISLTPAFHPSDFLWLDAGGLIAVANLRGGGEYGERWHQAGMLERKQNVFDDFIAAAEWLRTNGRADRIAIEGGSNGGLLVAAVTVQRPDLFDRVVCRVPVADMLRYHLFTVGRFWIPEYGCADDPQQFPFLWRYSPYHNIADGVAYPATLVMTADTDDRVAPGMAKKFAARLQEASGDGSGPILLRVETRAGHGAGKPISKQIDEQADIYAFLFNRRTGTSASEHERR